MVEGQYQRLRPLVLWALNQRGTIRLTNLPQLSQRYPTRSSRFPETMDCTFMSTRHWGHSGAQVSNRDFGVSLQFIEVVCHGMVTGKLQTPSALLFSFLTAIVSLVANVLHGHFGVWLLGLR
jgi:hypothetical protein